LQCADNQPLADWVSVQRKMYKKEKKSKTDKSTLDLIGNLHEGRRRSTI